MSLADTVRRLVEAGASPEVIAIAVEAIEQAGQKKPRSSSAERQARYRARLSSDAETVTSDVTRDVTGDAQCDATRDTPLPLPPSPQTPQPPTPSREYNTPLPPEGRSRRKPSKPIPDGFPTGEDIAEQQAKARAAGANLDVSAQAERFRNHAQQNDRRCADWRAAWRNWVASAIERAPKTAMAAIQGRAPASDADRWRRWLTEFRKNSYWPTDDAGPRPGHPACRVPPALLAEFGFTPPAANDPKPDLFAGGEAA